MSKSLLRAAASTILSVAVVLPCSAVIRGRHVPDVVSRLQPAGLLEDSTSLHLAIGLPVRNQAAMNDLLRQVYDPASTNYHKFLTPEEFTSRFGPTEEDYQKVITFAQQHGLTVEATHPNRMILDVVGGAADVEQAFGLVLHTYEHPTEKRTFFAPDVEPSVPGSVPIQDVSGLDNYRRPYPRYHFKPVAASTNAFVAASVTPKTGSGPFGNYIGDDFRKAYVPGTTLNGSGQSVALVQFDGYYASDISAYAALAGRANVPLINVLLDGFNGLPTMTGGEVEVSLDIEMVISMAPTLASVIVYEGNPFNFHPNNVLNRIATDNSARQVSCSWGWTGGPNSTTEQIFAQMALQGQSFFNASGDDDAFLPGQVDDPTYFGTPSASPNITQVGGTTLTMTSGGGAYVSEVVWNWGGGIGSSGGYSSYYTIPSWQSNIDMTASGGSPTGRNIPDVALTADDVLVIADGGVYYPGVGGTSCAAPLWAGYCALVNQLAANNGRAAVGFINPAIYAMAKTPNYTSLFHDTTVGDNTWSASPTKFFAVPNYDLCTGLGTPNGTNLIFALAGTTNPVTRLPAPRPPHGTNLAALKGDPNGNWMLFVVDDLPLDAGAISNGWVLTLTTATPVGQASDVGVSLSAVSTNVPVGSNAVFVVGVTNYGPSSASNVLVTDALPLGSTYLSNQVTAGSVVLNDTLSGKQLAWSIGTLATNAGARMTITVRADSAIALVNNALVDTSTDDPNPDDNLASVSVNAFVVVTEPVQLLGAYLGGGTGFQISGSNTTSSPLIIQASTNLISWVPVFTSTPPPNIFNYIDHDATNYPIRYYRSVTQ